MGEETHSLPIQRLVLKSLAILFIVASVSATQASAADGSYLDALKAEAKSDTPSTGPTAGTDDGRPTPRTDDQPQMEEWLEKNYIGSYMFYQKLSETKQKAVYRLYRAGAEITKIREKINELLKQ